jgi:crotonobetainyl-CoA:carnitine CoA-transferase CaiB-like acyl-CoA transferase
VQALGILREFAHPTAGTVRVVAPPVHLSRSPFAVAAPPPALGNATERRLKEAGFSDDEIAAMRADGVI